MSEWAGERREVGTGGGWRGVARAQLWVGWAYWSTVAWRVEWIGAENLATPD